MFYFVIGALLSAAAIGAGYYFFRDEKDSSSGLGGHSDKGGDSPRDNRDNTPHSNQ